MRKNPFLWFSAAFFVVGVMEAMEAFDFLTKARWPPLIDKSVITIMLLSPLFLAGGAMFLVWTRRSAELCLWVLAFWWPWYIVTAHGVTVNDLTTPTHIGNLRYHTVFLLSAIVIGCHVRNLFGTISVRGSYRVAVPLTAMLIVFLPWFGSYMLPNQAPIELALGLIYAVTFVGVLGHEVVNRTPSSR